MTEVAADVHASRAVGVASPSSWAPPGVSIRWSSSMNSSATPASSAVTASVTVADAVDVAMGGHRLLGLHVDVRPERVVGADRHQGEVEGPEVGPDGGEPLRGAGVAREVGGVPWAVHGPARPERLAVDETATGVVPRLGAGEPHAGDLVSTRASRGR